MSMIIELADPDSPDARRLLGAHADDMAARYDGGNWAGVDGRKDLLWLARDEAIALYRHRGYRHRDAYEGSDVCGDRSMYFERSG